MGFDAEKIIPPGAKIKVIGIGGGGGNAVNTMIRSNLEGVDFIAANTDVQALRFALPDYKIQVGKELTKGLGAGADPDVGRDAALEDRHEIQEAIAGADMVFITAGMGGGTGTGGASVIAQIAREMGALTVAVVTKPFNFEGKRRRKHAELGIERLRECVDTLITIPNQRLLQIATPDLSMVDAFRMADEVLVNAVKGISDIINVPGTVNVDFADVKTVMSSMGLALMGIGRATGETRAVEAARQAIRSPLLEDVDIEGATGILINITAGSSISLMEVNEACSIIQDAAHEDANIIFGAVIDENCGDEIRVTVIATGFPADYEDSDDLPQKHLFGARRDDSFAAKMPLTRKPITRPRVHESKVNFNHSPAPRAEPRPEPAAEPTEEQSDHFAAEDLAKMTFAPQPAPEPRAAREHSAAMTASPSPEQVQETTTETAPEPAAEPQLEQTLAPDEQVEQEQHTASPARVAEAPEYEQPAVWAESAEETSENRDIEPVLQAAAAEVDQQLEASDRAEGSDSAVSEPREGTELSASGDANDAAEAREIDANEDEEQEPRISAAQFEEFDLDPVIDLREDLEDEDDDDFVPAGPPPMESYFSDARTSFDQKIDEALELAERLKGGEDDQGDEKTSDELDIPAFLREGRKDFSLD